MTQSVALIKGLLHAVSCLGTGVTGVVERIEL